MQKLKKARIGYLELGKVDSDAMNKQLLGF